MLQSDLLFENFISTRIEELNKVKDYLIFAATSGVKENDSTALEHLQTLVYMTNDLNGLLANLPFITCDIERLSNS